MIEMRLSEQRGEANFGWLQSKHSFSFGSYYDPAHRGHGALLVINDDVVASGQGFGTHPHRNMEILSYVLEGTIAHRDSEGNEYQVPAGEFQLMSAGTGITHSEFNASDENELRFLQIWITPNVVGTKPGYQQKLFASDKHQQLILSPDGEQGSLIVKQDAWLTRVKLQANESLELDLSRTSKAYIQVVDGDVTVNEVQQAKAGDGVKLFDEAKISLASNNKPVETLLFEV